jgi:hypothetical protein
VFVEVDDVFASFGEFMCVAILLIPEAEPSVKVVRFNDEETVGEDDIP